MSKKAVVKAVSKTENPWKVFDMIESGALTDKLFEIEQEGFEVKQIFPTGTYYMILARFIG